MTRSGPLWTMLVAVWAFVLLGGAPMPTGVDVCRNGEAPSHHHDAGCMLCCPCTVAGAALAIPAHGAALPAPRGGVVAGGAAPWPPGAVMPQPVPVRARGPPGVA